MYQPKTGQKCACKPGVHRDNCPTCEGTGWVVDFHAIHAARIKALAKSTPGPWEVVEQSKGDYDVDSKRHNIATVSPHPPECEANARLIAAAPDLLEALRALFDHCEMIHKQWGDGSNRAETDSAIRFARAAIAKAEGK